MAASHWRGNDSGGGVITSPGDSDGSPNLDNDASYIVLASDVHKWFGDEHVLKGINLKVRRGEVTCILGPSGSGKSTFLRTLNHLESIQGGEILVEGCLVGYEKSADGRLRELGEKATSRARRHIGMVFQDFNLFWHMTLMENVIDAPMRVLGLPKSDAIKRGEELLSRVGLSSKADAYPRKLSGGQQQRGAIARALAMQPIVMLFDEPTSALDPMMTREVLGVIEELAAEGMTMIIVSHEAAFARRAADTIVLMKDGYIVDEATADMLVNDTVGDELNTFLGAVL